MRGFTQVLDLEFLLEEKLEEEYIVGSYKEDLVDDEDNAV